MQMQIFIKIELCFSYVVKRENLTESSRVIIWYKTGLMMVSLEKLVS